MRTVEFILVGLGLLISYQSSAQSTWFTGHNIPHLANNSVGGTAQVVDESKQRVLCMWNANWTGNSSSRFAYYNTNTGNLVKHFDLVKGSYLYESAERFIQFNDNSFLIGGGGANPNSNGNYTNHTLIADSNGTIHFFRHLTEHLRYETKTSDSSFIALEGGTTFYLTHFNTKGDTLWQIPYSQLLGISALDSTYSYNLLQMECIAGECLAWLKHKSIEQQLIFHFNPSTGIVSKRDTLNIVGFVKGNRLNEKGWDGYVFIYSDSSKSQKISFLNASFNSQWEIRQSANLGIDLKYAFINNDSDLVFSVWYSSKFRTYSTHTYSRIYAVDFTGNESFAAQYFDTIREYRCSPKHQFEDGGYLLNIQSYHHIAESFGSLIARSKIDGTVIDTAKERGWNGSGPFKDVPLFDPFADNTDTTNIGMKAFKNSYSLRIYPNPASSLLSVELTHLQIVDYQIQNLNGQTLLKGHFERSTQISTSNLPNGIYFLHLKGEGIIETRKIVVQR
jgi:hypothetical protein